MFVNRETELKFLEERWLSGKAELIIIYGRRGIGKTELIKKFLKNKRKPPKGLIGISPTS